MGLVANDPDQRGVRVAKTRRSGSADSDNVEDNGEECDKYGDIDCESETSDLLSLTESFCGATQGSKEVST